MSFNDTSEQIDNLVNRFRSIEKLPSEIPEFTQLKNPLSRSLWVLWVSKDFLKVDSLSPSSISHVLRKAQEVNEDRISIINALNKAERRVYKERKGDTLYYELMQPGREYVRQQASTDKTEVLYFRSGETYSSKRMVGSEIFSNLVGPFNFVDPYVGVKTLDFLAHLNLDPEEEIKFLTCFDNINQSKQKRFIREYRSFYNEHQSLNIEFRDYSQSELHDRYVMSKNKFILLGHGVKDIGKKESFVVIFEKSFASTIYSSVHEVFNRRWKSADIIRM